MSLNSGSLGQMLQRRRMEVMVAFDPNGIGAGLNESAACLL